MSTEPTDTNNIPKDGLSPSAEPVPREPGSAPEAAAAAQTNSPDDPADNSSAREDVPGLNKAVGPAEESDDQMKDDRSLTTDISPTD